MKPLRKHRAIVDAAILSERSTVFTAAYYDLRAGKNVVGNAKMLSLKIDGFQETEENKKFIKVVNDFEELLYLRGRRTGNSDIIITDKEREPQAAFGEYKHEFNPITSRYFNSFLDLGRLYEVGEFYESIGNDISDIESEIDETEDYIRVTKEKAYNVIRELNNIKIEKGICW